MAHHGAKNIILASRSGLTQPNTKDMIGNLEKLGVKVEIRQCDVGNGDAVRYMVLECAEIMPPIGGVIHGAFVNRVGVLIIPATSNLSQANPCTRIFFSNKPISVIGPLSSNQRSTVHGTCMKFCSTTSLIFLSCFLQ